MYAQYPLPPQGTAYNMRYVSIWGGGGRMYLLLRNLAPSSSSSAVDMGGASYPGRRHALPSVRASAVLIIMSPGTGQIQEEQDDSYSTDILLELAIPPHPGLSTTRSAR